VRSTPRGRRATHRKIREREVIAGAEDRVTDLLCERIDAAVPEVERRWVAALAEATPGIDRALRQMLVEWHHLDFTFSARAPFYIVV
jgi:hypothetical protein